MKMIEVKASGLTGAALDWAVAKIDPMCNGLEWKKKSEGRLFVGFGLIDGVMQPCAYLSNGAFLSERLGMHRNGVQSYSPSTDWSQGGPLIDKWDVWIYGPTNREPDIGASVGPGPGMMIGETRLIAACRAIVAVKLGDLVQVPAELIQESNHDSK